MIHGAPKYCMPTVKWSTGVLKHSTRNEIFHGGMKHSTEVLTYSTEVSNIRRRGLNIPRRCLNIPRGYERFQGGV